MSAGDLHLIAAALLGIASVVLLIALGSMIGALLTDSGGADVVVDRVVGRVRARWLPWAVAGVAALKADMGLTLAFGLVIAVPTVIIAGPSFGTLVSPLVRAEGAALPMRAATTAALTKRPAFALTGSRSCAGDRIGIAVLLPRQRCGQCPAAEPRQIEAGEDVALRLAGCCRAHMRTWSVYPGIAPRTHKEFHGAGIA